VTLWGVVALLLVALVAAVAVKVGRARQDDREAILAAACDLAAGPCTAAVPGGGAVELSLSPRPIPLAAPLTVRARFRGLRPAHAELRIVSTSMDMGTTRVALTPAPSGELVGEEALPVCVTGTMTWLAALHVDGHEAPVAHFRFDTRTP